MVPPMGDMIMGRGSRTALFVVAAGLAGALTLGGMGSTWAASSHSTHGPRHHHHHVRTISGTVTSLGSGSFVLTESNGTAITVDVNSSTKYSETGTKTAPSGVAQNERVVVVPTKGTSPTATTITAARVLIELTQVSGMVQTVGGSSFTVVTQGGLVQTVDTSGTTTYTKDGTTESGVSSGEYVSAFGTPDTTNPSQLDAQFVDIYTPPTPPTPHRYLGAVSGTVTSLGSGSFVLTESNGTTTITVDVNSSTKYSETGTKTAPSGVAQNERVVVVPTQGTSPTATTITAARVLIVLTQVSGMVQTVGGSSFTVVTQGGLVQTVDTSGTTTYTKDGTTESGVSSGEYVSAFGTPDTTDPSQLDAQFVDIYTPGSGPWHQAGFGLWGYPATSGIHGGPGAHGTTAAPFGAPGPGHGQGQGQAPGVVGTVKSVTGDDIVVETASGSSTTVVVSDSTKYLGPSASSGLNGVGTGDKIAAFGTTDSSGDFDATVVIVGTGTTPPPTGHGAIGTASTPGVRPGQGNPGGTTTPPSWSDAGSTAGHPGPSAPTPTGGQGSGTHSFGGGTGTPAPTAGSPEGQGGTPSHGASGR